MTDALKLLNSFGRLKRYSSATLLHTTTTLESKFQFTDEQLDEYKMLVFQVNLYNSVTGAHVYRGNICYIPTHELKENYFNGFNICQGTARQNNNSIMYFLEFDLNATEYKGLDYWYAHTLGCSDVANKAYRLRIFGLK